jgi:hypothetical protein
VTVASAAYPPPAAPPAVEGPRLADAVVPAAATVAASPLDEPLRLVGLARQSYQRVQDYQCRMVKRERIGNRLQPENTMLMYVRTNPLSIFFHWVAPADLAGQEVCYVAGRYNGNMRVRPHGLLGATGFHTIEPNDPRARQTSRHPITDAGIGALIDQLAAGWANERRWAQTQVTMAEYDFDGRRCVRVDAIHQARDGRFQHYRDIVYFDKTTALPIRMEAYDWPRRAGDGGELLEMYSYVGLRLNVGLRDDVFNR